MIILSNSTEQTLAPGQSMTFDTIVMHTGCAEGYRNNSGSVVLRARKAIYECCIGANIGSTTADTDAQLAICLNGSPILETTMLQPTTTVGDLENVSRITGIRTDCNGGEYVTITNTRTTTITIGAHPNLFIKREA